MWSPRLFLIAIHSARRSSRKFMAAPARSASWLGSEHSSGRGRLSLAGPGLPLFGCFSLNCSIVFDPDVCDAKSWGMLGVHVSPLLWQRRMKARRIPCMRGCRSGLRSRLRLSWRFLPSHLIAEYLARVGGVRHEPSPLASCIQLRAAGVYCDQMQNKMGRLPGTEDSRKAGNHGRVGDPRG